MNPKLSPTRKAFLKLIMASYGPWYLLRLPSGKWNTCWWYNAHDDEAMESYLTDDNSDGPSCFSTKHEALKEILRSLDSEIEAGGAGYVADRMRARDSLILAADDEHLSSVQDEFSGTLAETQLLDDWMRSDQSAANAKIAETKRRAAHEAACLEQQRREQVFEQLLIAFGNEIVNEINAAIERAWVKQPPRSRRTIHGQKAGEVMPMPQLSILSGRAVFHNSGWAKPLRLKTPLSARDTRYGYKNHWQHPTWVEIVIPAIAEIIVKFEKETQALPRRTSKLAELP